MNECETIASMVLIGLSIETLFVVVRESLGLKT